MARLRFDTHACSKIENIAVAAKNKIELWQLGDLKTWIYEDLKISIHFFSKLFKPFLKGQTTFVDNGFTFTKR